LIMSVRKLESCKSCFLEVWFNLEFLEIIECKNCFLEVWFNLEFLEIIWRKIAF
jgi:hypothetical protein